MTMEEKHAYRLIRDLFAHKDAIFGELKRASSLSHSGSITEGRPRAISTDESNRKANMEARTRALLAGSTRSPRATSPAPGPRGHRRDKSSGGAETRFPIHPSSAPAADIKKSRDSLGGNPARRSLEVPSSTEASPVGDNGAGLPLHSVLNGSGDHNAVGSPIATEIFGDDIGVEKRNSLGRSGHVGTRLPKTRKQVASLSRQSLENQEPVDHRPVGVSLVDKPMDD
jgi:hypothetical protein